MTGDVLAAAASLSQVIANLTNWIVGFLVGLATLFLDSSAGCIGPRPRAAILGAVEKAKGLPRSRPLIGYAPGAILATAADRSAPERSSGG